jgi:hypothetical protein
MDNEVRIPFKREANGYEYNDTIILPFDHKYSNQDIEEMQNKRFANWISLLHNKENTGA